MPKISESKAINFENMPKVLGKLIGGGIGYYLGGPIGALIGMWLGHCSLDVPETSKSARKKEIQQLSDMVSLAVEVIKTGGQVSQDDIKFIQRIFQNTPVYKDDKLMLIKELIDEALNEPLKIEKICARLRRSSNYKSNLSLLSILYQMAYRSMKIQPEKQAVVSRIAGLLGISEADHQKISAKYQAHEENYYYKLLGITRNTDIEQIKKIYRQLVQENHPDKLDQSDEEGVKAAHQKITEINEAYEYVRRQKGF